MNKLGKTMIFIVFIYTTNTDLWQEENWQKTGEIMKIILIRSGDLATGVI